MACDPNCGRLTAIQQRKYTVWTSIHLSSWILLRWILLRWILSWIDFSQGHFFLTSQQFLLQSTVLFCRVSILLYLNGTNSHYPSTYFEFQTSNLNVIWNYNNQVQADHAEYLNHKKSQIVQRLEGIHFSLENKLQIFGCFINPIKWEFFKDLDVDVVWIRQRKTKDSKIEMTLKRRMEEVGKNKSRSYLCQMWRSCS